MSFLGLRNIIFLDFELVALERTTYGVDYLSLDISILMGDEQGPVGRDLLFLMVNHQE